jgi:hypothetical protein
MNERTVTDLETTALEASEEAALLLIDYGEQTADDRHGVICAAVRELARRADDRDEIAGFWATTQFPEFIDYWFTIGRSCSAGDAIRQLMDEKEAAEADRDRLQAERDGLAVGLKYADQKIARYREALEQINHFPFDVNKTAPEDLMAIKEVARAALATPDTPPDETEDENIARIVRERDAADTGERITLEELAAEVGIELEDDPPAYQDCT